MTACQNEHCRWIYRCCKFEEINGVVKCEEMCEAVINCEQNENNTSNEVESFNTTTSNEEESGKIIYVRRRICRKGFRFTNGQCRRVL